MSFSVDVSKFVKKTNANAEKLSRAIPIALFNGVIRKTRVDTGRLRGNWQTTTNIPATVELERYDSPGTQGTGRNATNEVIRNIQSFSITYLTNNLPYAEVYEEKDAMIQSQIQRINRIIKEAVNNL